MSIIVSPARVVECMQHSLEFENADGCGGYSFECDENGVIEPLTNQAAVENFRRCMAGEDGIIAKGVDKREWTYRQAAIGKCYCGAEVHLDHFTNPCNCGRDYDSAGNMLASREQWGGDGWNEDGTPETVGDILRIP